MEHNRAALINSLIACALSCEKCAELCLHENKREITNCITLTYDCADVCMQAVKYIQRKSPITIQYMRICSELCRICAQRLMKHEITIPCAQACIKCAEECEHYEAVDAEKSA